VLRSGWDWASGRVLKCGGFKVRWSAWLWTRLLFAADRLLGSRLVEWELVRRQRRIDRLMTEMDAVVEDLDALKDEVAFFQLVMCLVDLRARSERDDLEHWLRFIPHINGEEALLDDAIEYLVKKRLATIDAEPLGPGQYVYQLHPDWPAILAQMRDRPVTAPLMMWLEQQSGTVQPDGE
jgi:hypothetical protein